MTPRIAAALAAFAIALIFAACGGDGGIDVVSDDERQQREETLDSELDSDAGLGDENSSEARDDTLDRELDGDARRDDADSDDAPEAVVIESLGVSIALRELPCFADDGFVRTSDGDVGCVLAAELADIVSCGDGSRPVLDLADLPDDAVPFTACVPIDETPDDVFEEREIDD